MYSTTKNIADNKMSKMLLFLLLLLFSSEYFAQNTVKIRMPKGRIAFTSDGNLHDSDDWGATAFSLAFIHYAGLEKRFVHYDYNNHIGKSRASWEKIMDDAAKGGAKRFGLDVTKVFSNQTAQKARNSAQPAKVRPPPPPPYGKRP